MTAASRVGEPSVEGSPVSEPWPRVLIIDDNRNEVDYITYFLGRASILCSYARSGDEGMRVLLAMQMLPDLVMCDLAMPGGMDGLDFARLVRYTEKTKRVAMVALTGATRNDTAEALEAGFDAVLMKPMNPWKLVEEVKALIVKYRR